MARELLKERADKQSLLFHSESNTGARIAWPVLVAPLSVTANHGASADREKARHLARFVFSAAVRIGNDGFAANRAVDLTSSPQSRRRSHHAIAAAWASKLDL